MKSLGGCGLGLSDVGVGRTHCPEADQVISARKNGEGNVGV